MTEAAAKSGSSLAIVEKRPHRPGGCLGIFFQLFDWKRRFAKKKLFSKKLLPPARQKQAPGKFAGDEKLPKLRLIANENSGGFPNVKINGTCNYNATQKPEMQSPGLVARLMGLESMPTAQEDALKKASSIKIGADKESKCGFDKEEKNLEKGSTKHELRPQKLQKTGSSEKESKCGFDKEEKNLEKGSTKHELRPQKLQKTGSSERQAVSRFGHESLHFRSVLSRSRKHRPKLASPVKSPRMSSGRNASRLIDAAARILEPGLQATNKAKCALSYSKAIYNCPKDEVIKGRMTPPMDLLKVSNDHVITTTLINGQSCKSCGSLLEGKALPLASSALNHSNPPILEGNKPKVAMPSLEQEKERVARLIHEQSVSPNAQARNIVRTGAATVINRKPLIRESSIQCHWKPQKDVPPPSNSFKHRIQRQNQAVTSKDRVPLKSNLSNMHTNRISSAANTINQTKHFNAPNRSPSGRTRSGMFVKVENCKCDSDRKSFNKQVDHLSTARKRRPVNANLQCESSSFSNSTVVKQRNIRRETVGFEAQYLNQTCSSGAMACPLDSNRTNDNKRNDVISFTFSSPMKQNSRSDSAHCNAQGYSSMDISDRKITSEKLCPLSGDKLGALLEQKLKELTCQEEDELGTEGIRPKRTTAMILQELISALTAERPVSHDVVVGSDNGKFSSHNGQLSNRKLNLQVKETIVGASTGCLFDGNHLSPGSVLEASFSNDSLLSSSVDDSSVPNLHPEPVDCTIGGQQPSETDAEFLDSATSLIRGKNDLQLVTDLLRHVSEVLCSFSFVDTGMKGMKLAHAEEVLLNAELTFRNTALYSSNGTKDFSIIHFLIYELETLASVFCTNFGQFLIGDQLKAFLLHCVIEYLDLQHGASCKSGFKAWSRMPTCMTVDRLIMEVVKEVKRWTLMAGKVPDEIVDRDMSHSFRVWTDFEIEAYEAGAVIHRELLEVLVDEVVMDVCERNPVASC